MKSSAEAQVGAPKLNERCQELSSCSSESSELKQLSAKFSGNVDSEGYISPADYLVEPEARMTEQIEKAAHTSGADVHQSHCVQDITQAPHGAIKITAEEDGSGSGGEEFGSSSGSNESALHNEDKPDEQLRAQAERGSEQETMTTTSKDAQNKGHEHKSELKHDEGLVDSHITSVGVVDAGKHEEEKAEDASDMTDQKKSKGGAKGGLKKPDKILPCPRCNSMDTKFCYYNNYNVTQPRHFCKSCQRYWTAGGTLRNVPVGSGRRKNKNTAQRGAGNDRADSGHMMVSPDASRALPSGNRGMAVHSSGGMDGLDSDSVVTAVAPAFIPRDPLEDPSHVMSASSMLSAHPSTPYGSQPIGDVHMAPPWVSGAHPPPWGPSSYPPPPYSYFPGGAWAYGYVQPPAAWSGVTPWAGTPSGTMNTQWGGPWGWGSPPPAAVAPSGAITLGKRSFEGVEDMSGKEGSPWVPKTLRIEETGEEDRRGSAWTRVGLAGGVGASGTMVTSGVVRPFPSKEMPPSVEVLQANPAAMARSMAFNES